MTSQPWHVAVLIPACNEEELLPRCLESVLESRARLRSRSTRNAAQSGSRHVTCDIVVAVDRSTDRTHAIARRLPAHFGVVLSTNAGAVGTARALAAQAALARYAGPRNRCWLANTDADCLVPPTWLEEQMDFAHQGIQALAGIIDVDSFAEHHSRVEGRFRTNYLIRPDGSHPHIHGANLGIRADAYLQAGGWSNLATAEDHDLWARLEQTGCRLHSSSRLQVVTSGRRTGRAPHGFAEALALQNETIDEPFQSENAA